MAVLVVLAQGGAAVVALAFAPSAAHVARPAPHVGVVEFVVLALLLCAVTAVEPRCDAACEVVGAVAGFGELGEVAPEGGEVCAGAFVGEHRCGCGVGV